MIAVDADAVIIEINNMPPEGNAEVTARVIAILADDGKLPGMPHDMPAGADYDTAADVGEIVKEYIYETAQDTHGLDGNDPGTLTARLWAVGLGRVDWRKVGAYYYTHAREAWAEQLGREAYPS